MGGVISEKCPIQPLFERGYYMSKVIYITTFRDFCCRYIVIFDSTISIASSIQLWNWMKKKEEKNVANVNICRFQTRREQYLIPGKTLWVGGQNSKTSGWSLYLIVIIVTMCYNLNVVVISFLTFGWGAKKINGRFTLLLIFIPLAIALHMQFWNIAKKKYVTILYCFVLFSNLYLIRRVTLRTLAFSCWHLCQI